MGCNHLPDKIVRQVVGDTIPGKLAGSYQVRPQDGTVCAHNLSREKTTVYSLTIRCRRARASCDVSLNPDLPQSL